MGSGVLGAHAKGAGDVPSERIHAEVQQEAGLPRVPIPSQHQLVHGAGPSPHTPVVTQGR